MAVNKGLVPVFASVVLVSVAQLCMKYGLLQMPLDWQMPGGIVSGIEDLSEHFSQWLPVLLPVSIGIGCYCASVLCWMKALQHVRLSVAYPLLSISYLIVHVAAAITPAFHESLHPQRLIGIVIVMLGIGLCVVPDRATAKA